MSTVYAVLAFLLEWGFRVAAVLAIWLLLGVLVAAGWAFIQRGSRRMPLWPLDPPEDEAPDEPIDQQLYIVRSGARRPRTQDQWGNWLH